jgi:hypothetical protein
MSKAKSFRVGGGGEIPPTRSIFPRIKCGVRWSDLPALGEVNISASGERSAEDVLGYIGQVVPSPANGAGVPSLRY